MIQQENAHATVHWLSPEEERQWDAFVTGHPLGCVYHLSAWKGVLEEAFPHIRGRFLALRDGLTGQIRAGLPLYTVTSWLLGNRIVSVPFASACDPLISTPEEFALLLPAIQEGKAVACHLVLRFKDRWNSEYSGNTNSAITGANQLLYWDAIQRAQASGAQRFSLGRTSPHHLGLLSYKQRWAPVEEDLTHF